MSRQRSRRSRRNDRRYGAWKALNEPRKGWRGRPKPVTSRTDQKRAERDLEPQTDEQETELHMTARPTWTVQPLIPAGVSVLEGLPIMGSTDFLLDVMLDVAAGSPPLRTIPAAAPRNVLYLALRDSDRSLQARCYSILGKEPIPGEFGYIKTVAPGAIPATIRTWMTRYPKTAIIVVDRQLAGENPAIRQGPELAAITAAHDGLAIVVVDGRTVGGVTAGIMGASSTIEFDRETVYTAFIKVTGRDVPNRQGWFRIKRSGSRWELDPAHRVDRKEIGP